MAERGQNLDLDILAAQSRVEKQHEISEKV